MSRDIAETITHNGFTINIHYDPDCDSPRENSNNGFFLGYKHRDYAIGDEQADPSTWTLPCPACKGDGSFTFPIMGEDVTRECDTCEGYGEREVRSFEDAVAYVREHHGALGPVLPVVMYDHGSVSYSVGRTYDKWDGGNAGLIFATKETLTECQGADSPTPSDENLTTWLTGEIEEYSAWASGDCYGYVILDRNRDKVGSCWGFIGEKWCIEAAKEECPDEDTQPVLHTLRMSDRTLDAIEAALTGDAWPAEVQRALEIVRGCRLGSDPEGMDQWGIIVTLVAHPPLLNAGNRATFRLTPVERSAMALQGWHNEHLT